MTANPTLTFLGGTGTVTGSKYLLEWAGRRVLVDCGLFQGWKELRLRNWAPLPVDPKTIDAVVLTHAHLDHSGYLPLLVKNGFKGPIHASHATQDLCGLLLRDSGHIQEADARYANKKGFSKHKPALPLYTQEDAEVALEQFEPVPFDQAVQLEQGLSVSLAPAGHILGSALVRFTGPERSILFTGDLGRPHDPVMYPPAAGGRPDYLVVESTYGDRLHEETDVEERLAEVVAETCERGGAVLIPTFAVGRAHALLYLLQKLMAEERIPDVPVFLDSPMAVSAMEIYCKHMREHRLDGPTCKRTCNVARYVRSVDESKELNLRKDPRIVLSASGMLTGGRVLHHLKHIAPDRNSTILFIGFQAGGTRGAQLLGGAKSVKVHGGQVKIRAEVACIDGLSAHADYREILAWLGGFERPPLRTFITHGEPTGSEGLRKRIADELGWPCIVPEHGDRVELPRRGGTS